MPKNDISASIGLDWSAYKSGINAVRSVTQKGTQEVSKLLGGVAGALGFNSSSASFNQFKAHLNDLTQQSKEAKGAFATLGGSIKSQLSGTASAFKTLAGGIIVLKSLKTAFAAVEMESKKNKKASAGLKEAMPTTYIQKLGAGWKSFREQYALSNKATTDHIAKTRALKAAMDNLSKGKVDINKGFSTVPFMKWGNALGTMTAKVKMAFAPMAAAFAPILRSLSIFTDALMIPIKLVTGLGSAFLQFGISVIGTLVKVGLTLAAIGIGAVAAFSALVIGAMRTGKELDALHRETQFSARDLLLMEKTLFRSGTSAKGAADMMAHLREEMQLRPSGAILSLSALGLEYGKIDKMDLPNRFAAIADSINKLPNPIMRAQIATQLFGAAGAKAVANYQSGDAAKTLTMYGKFAVTVAGARRSMQMATDSWGHIKQIGSDFILVIASKVGPIFEKVTGMVEGWIPVAIEFGEKIGAKLAAAVELVTGMFASGDFGTALKLSFKTAFDFLKSEFFHLGRFIRDMITKAFDLDWSPMLTALTTVFSTAGEVLKAVITKAIGVSSTETRSLFNKDNAMTFGEGKSQPEQEHNEVRYRKQYGGKQEITEESLAHFKADFGNIISDEVAKMGAGEFGKKFGEKKDGNTVFAGAATREVDTMQDAMDKASAGFAEAAKKFGPTMKAAGESIADSWKKTAEESKDVTDDMAVWDALTKKWMSKGKEVIGETKAKPAPESAVRMITTRFDEMRRYGGGLPKQIMAQMGIAGGAMVKRMGTMTSGFGKGGSLFGKGGPHVLGGGQSALGRQAALNAKGVVGGAGMASISKDDRKINLMQGMNSRLDKLIELAKGGAGGDKNALNPNPFQTVGAGGGG